MTIPIHLCCDNWPECDSKTPALSTMKATHDRARAGGWHIWQGLTMGGGISQSIALCPRCVGRHARPKVAPRLEGDVPLFEMEPGEAPSVGE